MPADANSKEKVINTSQLFDLSNVEQFEFKKSQQCFATMCTWINSGANVEDYLKILREHAIAHEEWAMPDVHTDLLEKIYSSIKKWLVPEERILLYKDSSFSAGKKGILITTKNIFAINKLQVERLPFLDIYSIHLSGWLSHGGWYFNANHQIEIDNMACSILEQGIIMALICMLIGKQHEVGYKIKFYNSIMA